MSDKTERLVNLTIALLEARRPITFAELRERTGYYGQDDTESARRMFERDKDDLRKLGVPVTTQEVAFGDEIGYRVPRREYELPDIALDADEVASLAIALRVSAGNGSALALAKLAARAPDPTEIPVPSTRVTLSPEPVDAVAAAVLDRAVLHFTYRTASGAVGPRTVDPYAVVRRRAAWYLVARDHDRDALRAFRLDRITDHPRAVSDAGAFAPPETLDVAAAVSGPEAETVEARVAVAPPARWHVELRGGVPTGDEIRGWPVLRIEAVDPARDRSWLLGLGADVVVLEPPELRDAVRATLEAVAGEAPR